MVVLSLVACTFGVTIGARQISARMNGGNAWEKAMVTSQYDINSYRCSLNLDGIEATTGLPVHGQFRLIDTRDQGMLIDREGQNWLVSPVASKTEESRIIPVRFQLILDAPLETRQVRLHFAEVSLPMLGRSIATVMSDSLGSSPPGQFDDWSMADVRLSGTCKNPNPRRGFRIPRLGLPRVTFSGSGVTLDKATVNDLLNSLSRGKLIDADLTITLPAAVNNPDASSPSRPDPQFVESFSSTDSLKS